MRIPLTDLSLIPADARDALARAGIADADGLLSRAATPRLRDRLARLTGLSADSLARWAGAADLTRVQGIDPPLAALLVSAGQAGSVQSLLEAVGVPWQEAPPAGGVRLAERETVRQAADSLADRLAAFAAQNPGAGPIPAPAALAEAAEEAAELRPRLVLAAPDDREAFRREVLGARLEAWRHEGRLYGILLGIFAAVCLLLIGAVWAIGAMQAGGLAGSADPLDAYRLDYLRAATRYGTRAAAAIGGGLWLGLVALLGLNAALSYGEIWLVAWLFAPPQYQTYYRKTTARQPELDRQRRRVMGIGLLALAAVSIGLSSLRLPQMLSGAFETDAWLRGLYWPVLILSVGIAAALAGPRLRFYLREFRADPLADEGGLRRALIASIVDLSTGIILLIAGLQIVLPLIMTTIRPLVDGRFEAVYLAEVAAIREGAAAAEPAGREAQAARDRLVAALDRRIAEAEADSIFSFDTEGVQATLDMGLGALMWMLIAALALLFVGPYLIVGGWRRGLFYIALLAASFAIDGPLQRNIPRLVGLREGTLITAALVAFLVFASALLFDWLYDTLTDTRRVCPGCRTPIDRAARFCPACGLTQE